MAVRLLWSKRQKNTFDKIYFPEIMTWLHKIIPRPCCEHFYVGTTFFSTRKKVVPILNCSQWGMWIIFSNQVMISRKRVCCWVFQTYFLGSLNATNWAPFSPMILERGLTLSLKKQHLFIDSVTPVDVSFSLYFFHFAVSDVHQMFDTAMETVN